MMPEMDGFDLAEQIRREPEIAGVRLLLLTSAGQPDDTARCRALAISACLTKPVRQSELFDALMKEMTLWNRSEVIRRPRRRGRAVASRRSPRRPASRPARRGSSRQPEGGRPHARASGSYAWSSPRTAARPSPRSRQPASTSS